MKKIFQCEKCGKSFETEEECLKHEKQCNKLLEDEITALLFQYGVTTQKIKIEFKNDTYVAFITSIFSSERKFDIVITFEENDNIDDIIKKALKNYIGTILNGSINNIVELCRGYDTYCINGFDMDLIGKLYEGHKVKLEILD